MRPVHPPDPCPGKPFRMEFGKGVSLVTQSTAMRQCLKVAWLAAKFPKSVVILGESGTGKELLTKLINCWRPIYSGVNRPLETLDLGRANADMTMSCLVGSVARAFTEVDKVDGVIHMAAGGDLQLDEFADSPAAVQSELLRIVENKQFRPRGEPKSRPVKCEFIATTNRDIDAMIKRGQFMGDLYHRLNGWTIIVPPLRERPEDKLMLAEEFARRHISTNDTSCFTQDARDMIEMNDWPGNVRELMFATERAATIASEEGESLIGLRHCEESLSLAAARYHPQSRTSLPAELQNYKPVTDVDPIIDKFLRENDEATVRTRHMHAMLGIPGISNCGAAKRMGIDNHTLTRRLRRKGSILPPPKAKGS